MADNTIPISLIRTKLYQPPIHENDIPRQHLLDRLDQRIQRPLTLVVAPAGYGKTSLVSCWMDASSSPSAWVSLDKNDNDLRLFLNYFLAAVRSMFPDVGLETQAMVNALTLPPMSALEEKTEGWVTGLILAAFSMRNQGSLDPALLEPHVSVQYVMEYLFTEVFSRQPPGLTRYLMSTAILDRFCGPLCEAVCVQGGDPPTIKIDGWEFIAYLKKQNLFLIPPDNEKRWFRFHHLFQKLLLNQLNRYLGPEDINVLHDQASAWFAENGVIEEALKHALAGGNSAAAARLVAQHGINLAQSAIENIPRKQRWPRIFVFAVRTVACQMIGDSEKAHFLIEEMLRDESLRGGISEGYLLATPCFFYWIEADLTAMLHTAARSQKIDADLQIPWTLGHGLHFSGIAYYHLNELHIAEKKLLPLVKSPYLHHTWNFAHSAFALALIYHARGRADEANEIADKLFISITTVKSHIQNIYGKLNVSKRREAVEKAMKIGILSI